MTTFKGELDGFFETGCEGMMWSLIKDGLQGYEALEFIEEGDHLKVFDADGRTVLFDGIINEDHDAGYMEYPRNPGHGQPCALGYWIHWTQTGWTPDAWASLFMAHKPPLRAELTKGSKSPS